MTQFPISSSQTMPEDFYHRVFRHRYEAVFGQPQVEGLDTSFIWVMTDGDQTVAAMNGSVRYQTLKIENLAIDPDWQGQGLGSQFLDYTKDYARQIGVTTLILTTRTYQAKDFYLKHGFEVYSFLEEVPFEGVGTYYLVYRLQ